MKRMRKPAEKPQKQGDTRKDEAKARKARPETTQALISAIDAGELDGRTSHVRRLLAVRKLLADHPQETVAGLVKDCLAVNSIVTNSLIKEICKPGFQVLNEKGELNPLLTKIWPETQKNILSAAGAFLRLEQAVNGKEADRMPAPAPDETPLDVSSIVLQLRQEEER